jgi:TIR domain
LQRRGVGWCASRGCSCLGRRARLTYAHRVRTLVKDRLEAAGFEVLLDVARLEPGDEWRAKLHFWLETCDAAVILLNPESMASPWVRKEADILMHRWTVSRSFESEGNRRLRIVPVFLTGALAQAILNVDGPVIVTCSSQDQAAGIGYELLARLTAGDDDAPGERASKAIGYDGAKGVSGLTMRVGPWPTAYAFRPGKVVNVDASSVIHGHSDVSSPEIGWLLLSAAGVVRPILPA